MKLVIIGGGSLNIPAFFYAAHTLQWTPDHVCLVGRSTETLEKAGGFCKKIVRHFGMHVDVSLNTDLAEAAISADVVLNMLRVGGLDRLRSDIKNLAESGAVGHAAVYPQAIHNIPVTIEAAKIVEKIAPAALWVNFSNPVSILCEAVALHTKLSCAGICYHSFLMQEDFAEILEVEKERVIIEYAGLNHIGWVTDVLVDNMSRIHQLVSLIRKNRNKKYNFWYASPDMIPIDHAFCLYHRGDKWYIRQKGIRGSIEDLLTCLGFTPSGLKKEKHNRNVLADLIRKEKTEDLKKFNLYAPWYAKCILPFLAALSGRDRRRFLVTVKHDKKEKNLPGLTSETGVEIYDDRIRPTKTSSRLPEYATEWLRQVRKSEHLLIQAVLESSYDLAFQAWAVHPSVASIKTAWRLAGLYFKKDIVHHV